MHKYLARDGRWLKDPARHLEGMPNGTAFLLKTRTGRVHFCELVGNETFDKFIKAYRHTDGEYFRLEKTVKAQLLLIQTKW